MFVVGSGENRERESRRSAFVLRCSSGPDREVASDWMGPPVGTAVAVTVFTTLGSGTDTLVFSREAVGGAREPARSLVCPIEGTEVSGDSERSPNLLKVSSTI